MKIIQKQEKEQGLEKVDHIRINLILSLIYEETAPQTGEVKIHEEKIR